MPRIFATWFLTCCSTAPLSAPVSIWICGGVDPTACAGWAEDTPALANASLTACVVTFDDAFIWNCEPPAKSMPKLNPRNAKLKMQMMIITSDARYHHLRVGTNRKVDSPRYILRNV